MIKDFIGERITPQSKYSVQYGVAYENNQLIKDTKKAKKILKKYKDAVENNWIVCITTTASDLKSHHRREYVILFANYTESIISPYYVTRKNLNGWRVATENVDLTSFPFHLECFRGNSQRFNKKDAVEVKKMLINAKLPNVSIEKYNPGLSDVYFDFASPLPDSIENRFELMDFD